MATLALRLILTLTFAALPLAGQAATSTSLRDEIRAARASYDGILARYPQAAQALKGLHLPQRLDDDAAALDAKVPDGFSEADWQATLSTLVGLDTNLVDQLAGSPSSFSLEVGLHEQIVRSAVDRGLDAVGVYVPATHIQSVAIVIHGNPQTESELLAQPYLRILADETGTILIAPYGRGSYDFEGPPTADLYGLTLLLQRIPALATLPFYLVGYSMGGFTAYKIGPDAPITWSGVLDISGSLVGSASAQVRKRWQHTRIYVVHGGNDTSIPTRFARDTAVFLFNSGIPVSYYEQGGAGHYLRELMPSVGRAWHDMLAGTVRDGAAAQLARDLQQPLPSSMAVPRTDRP